MYTPAYPSFTIKLGYKGVFVARTCFPDVFERGDQAFAPLATKRDARTSKPMGEAVLTSTHNLCFGAKIRKNMYTPAYPSFTINWGIRGYSLHGHVFLMFLSAVTKLLHLWLRNETLGLRSRSAACFFH